MTGADNCNVTQLCHLQVLACPELHCQSQGLGCRCGGAPHRDVNPAVGRVGVPLTEACGWRVDGRDGEAFGEQMLGAAAKPG